MGRRGTKEYRPHEALALIAADRGHVPLVCPSCGTRSILRIPRRRPSREGAAEHERRITLTCSRCNRSAVYLASGEPQADNELKGKGGQTILGG